MAIDRLNWDEYVGKKVADRVRKQADQLRQVAQAVPAMESLTGDKHWDQFVSVLQARLEQTSNELAELQETAMLNESCNGESLVWYKMRFRILRARIDTLHEVIALPKILLEEGEQAAALLKKHQDEIPEPGS
jgi:hypothetical protein